jgi:catechol-2,3-dioxygenase
VAPTCSAVAIPRSTSGPASVDPSPRPPLGLGELVLRVHDLDGMQRFYQEVFVADPEGNVVELVCHDPSLGP